MTTISLPDELAERLYRVAQERGQTFEDLLNDVVTSRLSWEPTPEERRAALHSMIGMFDVGLPDFSSVVREEMTAYYRQKFGNGDVGHSD